MSSDPRTHYLNADFDLGLRPRAPREPPPRLARRIRELSVQALLGAGSADAAMVRGEVPDEFLEHLSSHGVPVPRLLRHPGVDPSTRLRPFGWSAEAIELNRLHDRPASHPSRDVIRRVNSRCFALELERELYPELAAGRILDDAAALDGVLAEQRWDGGWVVKSEFGNAGLANRRLRSTAISGADRRFVDGLLAEDDRVVVEPWLDRERDWSVVFDVPLRPGSVRVHETIVTRDGALVGALFAPGGIEDRARLDALTEMAERVASRLAREGYFGPVCVDAIGWRDGETRKLRPLVDLNCRRSMSDGAHRLWRRIAPQRTLYYRFFNRRRLALPESAGRIGTALGGLDYDPDRRRGVLVVSPPEHGKLAVMFVAEDRSSVRELESELRARFEA